MGPPRIPASSEQQKNYKIPLAFHFPQIFDFFRLKLPPSPPHVSSSGLFSLLPAPATSSLPPYLKTKNRDEQRVLSLTTFSFLEGVAFAQRNATYHIQTSPVTLHPVPLQIGTYPDSFYIKHPRGELRHMKKTGEKLERVDADVVERPTLHKAPYPPCRRPYSRLFDRAALELLHSIIIAAPHPLASAAEV